MKYLAVVSLLFFGALSSASDSLELRSAEDIDAEIAAEELSLEELGAAEIQNSISIQPRHNEVFNRGGFGRRGPDYNRGRHRVVTCVATNRYGQSYTASGYNAQAAQQAALQQCQRFSRRYCVVRGCR